MTAARSDSPRSDALFSPFAGWLVREEWASDVIMGAYDSFSPEERRAIAIANPYSYVNITRSPEDLHPGESASVEDLAAEGAAALRRLLDADVFAPTGRPALYVYRMNTMENTQTGVVGTVPVAGFADGRVRTHENVRPSRTHLLARHIDVVGATSSPIALTFTCDDDLRRLFDHITRAEPDLDHLTDDVRHEMWTVPAELTDAVIDCFEGKTLYLTDGHHRAAAAAAARRAYGPDPVLDRTLAVAFPDDDLLVAAFHRVVTDADRRPATEIVGAISVVTTVTPVEDARRARPRQRGEVGLYAHGAWYRLALPPPAGNTALDRLDVERLRASILDPLLGADELGQTGAVGYVPDPQGITEVVRRCDAKGCVGFLLYPTAVSELMAVADAGQLMPPKSSYFAPKPRSGVFLRVLGRGATAHLPPS